MMAVQFVSAVFMTELISCKSSALALLYTILTAGIWTVLLLSESRGEVLLKWLLSVPLCYPVLLYFWHTHYAVRALNRALPGYGRQSAGGAFAGSMFVVLLTALCAIGLTAALARPQEPKPRQEAVRLGIGAGYTALVAIAIVMLEQQFPAYEMLISSV